MSLFKFIIFLIALTTCQSQYLDDKLTIIDAFIDEYMQCFGIPGMSFSIVQDGEVIVSKGKGKSSLEEDIDADERTLFGIGSTSKAFNAALLSILLQEHESFTWDTPARDIIGDSFYLSDGYRTNYTTLRDMIAHKTGIPRHDIMWLLDKWSREETMERLRFFNPIHPARTTFLYNNYMFMAAGVAAEKMGGASWEDLIQSRIFDYLGMDDSTYVQTSGPEYEGFATPYLTQEDGDYIIAPWDMFSGCSMMNPAGCIMSNAQDMAKWLLFLLDEADPDSIEEAAQETYEKTEFYLSDYIFQIPDDPVTDTSYNTYARGWFKGHYRGQGFISHGGDLLGYHTMVSLLPDYKLGIYHSFNLPDPALPRHMLHTYIADILLERDPWFNASMVCDSARNDKQHLMDSTIISKSTYKIPSTVENDIFSKSYANNKEDNRVPLSNLLDEYVGEYGNFAYGNLSVFFNEDQSVLRMSYGKNGDFDLIPTAVENVFTAEGNRSPSNLFSLGPVIFTESEDDGSIKYVRIPALEPSDIPVFQRGLKFSDAPPPRDCP